jgi:hypothetical protein
MSSTIACRTGSSSSLYDTSKPLPHRILTRRAVQEVKVRFPAEISLSCVIGPEDVQIPVAQELADAVKFSRFYRFKSSPIVEKSSIISMLIYAFRASDVGYLRNRVHNLLHKIENGR